MQRVARNRLVVTAFAWLALTATAHAQFGSYSHPYAQPQLVGISAATTDDDIDTVPHVALAPHSRQTFNAAVAALDTIVRGAFIEAPLKAAIANLEGQTGVRMPIDVKSLSDGGLDLDLLVTCNTKAASLRVILAELLGPHDLAWAPQPTGITITTKDGVSTNPQYRMVVIYPVYDLVAYTYGRHVVCDFDSLIDAITTVVHMESWREGGTGEGVIVPFDKSASLMIAQEWMIHEEIAALLTGLRKVKAQQRIAPIAIPESGTGEPDDRNRYIFQLPVRRRQRIRWSAAPSVEPSSIPAGGVF